VQNEREILEVFTHERKTKTSSRKPRSDWYLINCNYIETSIHLQFCRVLSIKIV